MMTYEEVITSLRAIYTREAEEREKRESPSWRSEERAHFLSLLQKEGKEKFLEIGAGTGKDSKFFHDNGLQVVCTDLTLEMVRLCREKGLAAHVMDFLNLDFPASSFDGVYAINCLLHVPKKDLPRVLEKIHSLMMPRGLFFFGVFGGFEFEGVWQDDKHEPKRFFSFFPDEQIQNVATKLFKLEYFRAIDLSEPTNLHFQSMILRRE